MNRGMVFVLFVCADLHVVLDDGGSTEAFKSLYLELSEYERDLGARWTDWFQQTLLYR